MTWIVNFKMGAFLNYYKINIYYGAILRQGDTYGQIYTYLCARYKFIV